MFLLTASVFILLLKNYLEKDRWTYALALMVAVAAIGYSKYHGILILLFALLPNLYLLRRWSFLDHPNRGDALVDPPFSLAMD